MLLLMHLFLRRIVGKTYDNNVVLAAHNCLPHVVFVFVVFYTNDADNSMVEMHVRSMHLMT